MLAYCDNTPWLLQYTCLLESSMAGGTVNNAKNQFLTLEFTIVFNLRVHNSPLRVRTCTFTYSVVSFIYTAELYSSLDNEPTCLIEFACINQLGCGFTAGKRTLLGNHSSTITV